MYLPYEPDLTEKLICLPNHMFDNACDILSADVETRSLLSCKSAWRIVHGLLSLDDVREMSDIFWFSMNRHPSVEGYSKVDVPSVSDVVVFSTSYPVHYGIMLEDSVFSIYNDAGPAVVQSVDTYMGWYCAQSVEFFSQS